MSECFKSFTYDGKSTETIISPVKLMLATFDGISSVVGVSREIQKGGTTITRPVANEYGTIANNATIEYCLIKDNFEPFTEQEQVTVERWLTSPKFSTDMVVYDTDDEEVCIYRGLFTNTSWIPHSRGYAGVQFTFECNSAYPFKQYTKTYSNTAPTIITLNCESDELNEYVYPILTVKENQETAFIDIKNVTDDGNTMSIRAYDRLKMTFDCQHCIPTDELADGIISYSDLGWNDVGDIYWLRLLPGDNELEISFYQKESVYCYELVNVFQSANGAIKYVKGSVEITDLTITTDSSTYSMSDILAMDGVRSIDVKYKDDDTYIVINADVDNLFSEDKINKINLSVKYKHKNIHNSQESPYGSFGGVKYINDVIEPVINDDYRVDIASTADITISYRCPYKLVGGWL